MIHISDYIALDEFILTMLHHGSYLDMALVGNFNEEGIGSRRDIDLAWHQDGIYSEELSKQQGGLYLSRPGIKYVGLYCVKATTVDTCFTLLRPKNNPDEVRQFDLRCGDGLIFDNILYEHSREGSVGDRLLARIWIG